ncbi:MAG: hypothetical protein HYV63_14910 [Candidatus Schekmanbacteria bacterium]|nr:hypothetical protein [Candidatus Schekmanbacteria bacterium]
MISVVSETDRLRRVVVQPPGPAHERMLPENIHPEGRNFLLFDDLIHVPGARREHRELCAVLGTVAEVGVFEAMLAEVLEQPSVRHFVVEETSRLTHLADADARRLLALDSDRLAASLIVGTLGGEVEDAELFPPLVNLIFTRDLAAVAHDLIIVGNAHKPARRRETVLTWAVVEHHPWFAPGRISKRCRWLRETGGSFPLTIEGGDVLVARQGLVLVGASERTTWSKIVHLSEDLRQAGVERMLVVEMPKQRSSMHLDTVLTFVDKDAVAVYGPILRPGGREECRAVRLELVRDGVTVRESAGNLLQALAAEGVAVRPIFCGGGHPLYEQREQWTDGANYVAIAPGIVVGYGRNEHTAQALAQSGYRLCDGPGFLKLFREEFGSDADRLCASGMRLAVHIDSNELTRGRGGPRCLTMPLERDGGEPPSA